MLIELNGVEMTVEKAIEKLTKQFNAQCAKLEAYVNRLPGGIDQAETHKRYRKMRYKAFEIREDLEYITLLTR